MIFDFDETLYLKNMREFVPHIVKRLGEFKSRKFVMIVLTYNARALEILKNARLERYFNTIVMIENKALRKSAIVQSHPDIVSVLQPYDRRCMLFFDNDPFNVYDMSTIGIASFLVNPVVGLSWDLVDSLLDHRERHHGYETLRSRLLAHVIRNYNYIDRATLTQNLTTLDHLT